MPHDTPSESYLIDVSSADLYGTDTVPTAVEISSMENWSKGVCYAPWYTASYRVPGLPRWKLGCSSAEEVRSAVKSSGGEKYPCIKRITRRTDQMNQIDHLDANRRY